MSRGLQALLGLFLLCLFTIGWLSWRLTSAERERDAARLTPAKQEAVVAHAKVDTVTVSLDAIVDTVRKTVVRVKTDTLMLVPETPQDTVEAVKQLVTLAAEHDALQRTTERLLDTLAVYKLAVTRRASADSLVIVGLEAELRRAQPGKLAQVWNRTKVPLALAVGLYVGARVTR